MFVARERVREQASVPTYIQNRTHDESMMTNGVSYATAERWRCTGNEKVTMKTWEEKAIE